jgi:pimeloyl-ACP methyl ester carboxylesterase
MMEWGAGKRNARGKLAMSKRVREAVRVSHPCGGDLFGLYCSSGPANFAVLYAHGFGSVHWGETSQALERACARRGWVLAAFDFRGHGQSGGIITDLRCSALLEDLDAMLGFLGSRGVEHVFPVGNSMGGWAASWWTVRNPTIAPACALIAPALRFPMTVLSRLTPEQHARGRATGRFRVRNDWLDLELDYGLVEDARPFTFDNLVSRWSQPAVLFHGMRDDVVPYQHSLEFAQQVHDPAVELRLYNQGDHRLVEYKDEIAESSCRFFERSLAQRSIGLRAATR